MAKKLNTNKPSTLKKSAIYIGVGALKASLIFGGCSGNTYPVSDPPAAIDEDPNYEEGASSLNGLSVGDDYIVVIDPADAVDSAVNGNNHITDNNQSNQNQENSTPMDALEWERAEGAEPERLHQELIQRFTVQGWADDDFRLNSAIFNESTNELSIAIETLTINGESVNARMKYILIDGNFIPSGDSFISHRVEGQTRRIVDEVPPRPR